jgi:hypothetical protein
MTQLRDLALYILIALAIGAAAYLYAIGVTPSLPVNSVWIGLCLNTMVVFGFVVKRCRRYWRVQRFWWTTLGLLLAHLAIYIVSLSRVDHFPLLWYVILNPVEWSVVFPILHRVLGLQKAEVDRS